MFTQRKDASFENWLKYTHWTIPNNNFVFSLCYCILGIKQAKIPMTNGRRWRDQWFCWIIPQCCLPTPQENCARLAGCEGSIHAAGQLSSLHSSCPGAALPDQLDLCLHSLVPYLKDLQYIPAASALNFLREVQLLLELVHCRVFPSWCCNFIINC